MSIGTVFLIAALGGVFAFARDAVAALRERRKRVTQEESNALRDPVTLHGLVLENTRESVALQAAVMADLRLTLENERRESAAKDAKIQALLLKLGHASRGDE